MTEFVSEVKTLPYDEQVVFDLLADLNNLEKIKDKIPQDKVKDFSFDRDSCSFSVNPVGMVKISIVDRESPKTIKFAADQSPVEMNMWIQLKGAGPQDTKMKLTVRADLNPFLKPMLSKPLQDGVDKLAAVLANISYETLAEKY